MRPIERLRTTFTRKAYTVFEPTADHASNPIGYIDQKATHEAMGITNDHVKRMHGLRGKVAAGALALTTLTAGLLAEGKYFDDEGRSATPAPTQDLGPLGSRVSILESATPVPTAINYAPTIEAIKTSVSGLQTREAEHEKEDNATHEAIAIEIETAKALPRPENTPTPAPTEEPTETATPVPTETEVATATSTPTPTATEALPTRTATAEPTATATVKATATEEAEAVEMVEHFQMESNEEFTTKDGKFYIVEGDILANGEQLYDDNGEPTGRMYITDRGGVDIKSPYGASVQVYESDALPPIDHIAALMQGMFDRGCEKGCDSVTLTLDSENGGYEFTLSAGDFANPESLQALLLKQLGQQMNIAEATNEPTVTMTPAVESTKKVTTEATKAPEPTETPSIVPVATEAISQDQVIKPVATEEPEPILVKTELKPGETITVEGPSVITGDIIINGVPQYDEGDGNTETGYAAIVPDGESVEVTAEWGGSVYTTKDGSNLNKKNTGSKLRQLFADEIENGCDTTDGDGCDVITVDVFVDGQEANTVEVTEENKFYISKTLPK